MATQERNKLTRAKIDAAKPGERPYKLFDGAGLFLLVEPNGRRHWRLKFRWQGKERLLALGHYPEVSLKEARQGRDEARRQLAQGINPVEARKAQRIVQDDTFQALALEWLEQQRYALAEETRRLAHRRLERLAFPAIGKCPIAELESREVLRLLRRIEAQGKHETAHRVRQRISQVCRYAIRTGRAERDPTAELKGALVTRPAKSHAAITNPRDAGALMRAIAGYEGQPTTWAALHLLALTFLRPGELRKASWEEMDFEAATWRVPAERMKMRREHIVPLAPQAVGHLQELYSLTGNRPYVFESTRRGRPLSENTVTAALRAMGYSGGSPRCSGPACRWPSVSMPRSMRPPEPRAAPSLGQSGRRSEAGRGTPSTSRAWWSSATRRHLDGSEAEPVTAEQAKRARQRLAELE